MEENFFNLIQDFFFNHSKRPTQWWHVELSKTSQMCPLLQFQLSITLKILVKCNKAKEIVKGVRIVIIWKKQNLSLFADNMVIEKSKLFELLKDFSQVAECKVTVYFKKSIL